MAVGETLQDLEDAASMASGASTIADSLSLSNLGVSVIPSRGGTVISVKIEGLVGKDLAKALKAVDHVVLSKVKRLVKKAKQMPDGKWMDPDFGPSADDELGVAAMCAKEVGKLF